MNRLNIGIEPGDRFGVGLARASDENAHRSAIEILNHPSACLPASASRKPGCYGGAMSPSGLHSLFEGLAWAAALAVGWWTRRHDFAAVPLPMAGRRYPVYLLVLWLGAVAGAYGLGSLNVALAGVAGEGRSILGAIVGGVIVAEIYKAIFGVRGSTGAVLVLPLAVAIAIGRIGCFLAGLPDYTYGTPSDLPWAVDFGDGIHRHPVQLYESLTMALFALGFFLWLQAPADGGSQLWILRLRRILRRPALPLGVSEALSDGAGTLQRLPSGRRSTCPLRCGHVARREARSCARLSPTSSTARPPRSARPAWIWCRPRS